MSPSSNQQPSERKRFKPKQSFDEYRLKHGPENRFYKSFDDPVSDKVSSRRRAQIILALIAIFMAIAATYFITRHL